MVSRLALALGASAALIAPAVAPSCELRDLMASLQSLGESCCAIDEQGDPCLGTASDVPQRCSGDCGSKLLPIWQSCNATILQLYDAALIDDVGAGANPWQQLNGICKLSAPATIDELFGRIETLQGQGCTVQTNNVGTNPVAAAGPRGCNDVTAICKQTLAVCTARIVATRAIAARRACRLSRAAGLVLSSI